MDAGENVLVAAPTGAGKTLVAEYAIHLAMQRGMRSLYTAPIKALSNQKFRDFVEDKEIGDAGLMTGDITLAPDSKVLVMTTEILRNTLFENPERLHDVGVVVFDEIHFMDDVERGSVWEETLMFLPKDVMVVCLSATIDNLGQYATWLERVRERPVRVVEETKRPVPLKHSLYHPQAGIFPPSRLKPIRKRFLGHKKDKAFKKRNDRPLLDELIQDKQLPLLYFCFSRKLCERKSTTEAKFRHLLSKEEKEKVSEVWEKGKKEFAFEDRRGPMQSLKKQVFSGIAAHHAGMLPLHKEMVERLFTRGLLKVLYTTETFAMGINMPARAVIFDSLMKFDGIEFDYMRTRDYLQMAGRAGRLGMDDEGLVFSVLTYDDVLDAPVHRIMSGKVEPITSRFNLGYATLVHLHGLAGRDAATEAWNRSFAAFQAREHSNKREEQNRRNTKALLDKRYEFLDALGFIGKDREVRPRGRTCLQLAGYEIQLTELLYAGVFDEADPPQLCALLGAVIYEGRKRDEFPPRAVRPFRDIIRRAQTVIQHAQDTEVDCGLAGTLTGLDIGMSPALYEYAMGASFQDLGRYTTAAPGDFVRIARMVVQYLRHLQSICEKDHAELHESLDLAIACLYRGPVDVRAELGLDESAEPKA